MARKTGATWHPGRPHQWGKRKLQTHFILQVSQVLHLPRKVTLVRPPYVFTLSALDAAGPRRFANNVQHHTSKVFAPATKHGHQHFTCCAYYERWKSSYQDHSKILRLSHQKYRRMITHVWCHKVPRLPRKTTHCQRHSQTAFVANCCGWTALKRAHHPPVPQRQRRTLCYAFGKQILDRIFLGFLEDSGDWMMVTGDYVHKILLSIKSFQ